MRHKIIVNPISNRGAGERLAPHIAQLLRFLEIDFEMVFTERPWHAAELAQQAVKDGFQVVVAAGGDGTVNEVLNGLMLAKDAGLGSAIMGVLAVGRGNDFAFGVDIPTGWQQGCQTLALNQRRWIDVGRSVGELYPEGRYFGNGVGIGFDAVVGFEAAKMTYLHGFPSYVVGALRTIFVFFHAPLLKIELDDQIIEQSTLLVSIMNGKRMGGTFMMAPESQPDDGLFSLCLARQVSRMAILGLIPRFMKGTQASHPAILMLKSRRVTVSALQGSIPAHADGETLCTEGQKLTIELLPHQLELIYQPETQTK
jgi:diacylglycerol kinase (ATP)